VNSKTSQVDGETLVFNNDRGMSGRGHVDGEVRGASESYVDERTSDDIYQDPIERVQEAEIRNAPRLHEEPESSDKKHIEDDLEEEYLERKIHKTKCKEQLRRRKSKTK
jgi:hypothetical protein